MGSWWRSCILTRACEGLLCCFLCFFGRLWHAFVLQKTFKDKTYGLLNLDDSLHEKKRKKGKGEGERRLIFLLLLFLFSAYTLI
jgi:hypothetical protein